MEKLFRIAIVVAAVAAFYLLIYWGLLLRADLEEGTARSFLSKSYETGAR